MAEITKIKKIQDSTGVAHDIDAAYWGGHSFSEVVDTLHGVVETYVVFTSKSSTTGYNDLVNSTNTTSSIAKTTLLGLLDASTVNIKVGDIILIEAPDKYDRWVSAVDGTNVTLSILETQVAAHHHQITVEPNTLPVIGTNSNGASVSAAMTGVVVVSNSTITNTKPTGEALPILADVTVAHSTTDLNASLSVANHSHNVSLTHNHTLTYGSAGHSHTIGTTPSSTSSSGAHSHTVYLTTGDSSTGTENSHTHTLSITSNTTDTVSSDTGHTHNLTLTSSSVATGSGSAHSHVVNLLTGSSKTSNDGTHTHGGSLTTGSSNTDSAGSHSHSITTTWSAVATTTSYANITAVTTAKAAMAYASVDNSGILSFQYETITVSGNTGNGGSHSHPYTGATGVTITNVNSAHQHSFTGVSGATTVAESSHTHQYKSITGGSALTGGSHTHTYHNITAITVNNGGAHSHTFTGITAASTNSLGSHQHSYDKVKDTTGATALTNADVSCAQYNTSVTTSGSAPAITGEITLASPTVTKSWWSAKNGGNITKTSFATLSSSKTIYTLPAATNNTGTNIPGNA